MSVMLISKYNTKYDERHDVLHVFFPPYALAFDDEDYPGVIIKRAAKDGRIIGLVILDYKKRSKKDLNVILPEFDFSQID